MNKTFKLLKKVSFERFRRNVYWDGWFTDFDTLQVKGIMIVRYGGLFPGKDYFDGRQLYITHVFENKKEAKGKLRAKEKEMKTILFKAFKKEVKGKSFFLRKEIVRENNYTSLGYMPK